MIPYLLPYSLLVLNGRRREGRSRQYSYWVWTYVLLSVTFPTLFPLNFAFQNASTLFLGTQVFWYVDRYDLLYQVAKNRIKSKFLIHSIDLFVHTAPLVITLHLLHRRGGERTNLKSGILLFLLHFTYGFLLGGSYQVDKFYRVTAKPGSVVKGWLIFCFFYLTSPLLYLQAKQLSRRRISLTC